MAAFALLDVDIIAGAVRLSTVLNEVTATVDADALDSTVFASNGWRSFIGGLANTTVDVKGFMDSTAFEAGALGVDGEVYANQFGGTVQVPLTVAQTTVDLAPCYVMAARDEAHEVFGKIGDLAPFAARYMGDGKVARGQILHRSSVLETVSGTGSTATLGTIPGARRGVRIERNRPLARRNAFPGQPMVIDPRCR